MLLLSTDEDSDQIYDPNTAEFYTMEQPPLPIPTSLLANTQPTQTSPENTSTEPHIPGHFHLSLYALTGQPSPKTLRFHAFIHGHMVSVLVDSGSSHNILQPRIATFLGLMVQPIDAFSVMVGNGSFLNCTGHRVDVPISICNYKFHIPFYLLPIHGADVVLGVQRLQSLGEFILDFTVPMMRFSYQGSIVTLTRTHTPTLIPATFHQINCMLHMMLLILVILLLCFPTPYLLHPHPIYTQLTQLFP